MFFTLKNPHRTWLSSCTAKRRMYLSRRQVKMSRSGGIRAGNRARLLKFKRSGKTTTPTRNSAPRIRPKRDLRLSARPKLVLTQPLLVSAVLLSAFHPWLCQRKKKIQPTPTLPGTRPAACTTHWPLWSWSLLCFLPSHPPGFWVLILSHAAAVRCGTPMPFESGDISPCLLIKFLRCFAVCYGVRTVFRTVFYGVLRCRTVFCGVVRCFAVSYGV